jgi:2-oxoglutarate ferredoxin oxidoreductase subunit beta
MIEIEDYQSDAENQWCPGCQNFGILRAMKSALVALARKPEEICMVSGIGQAAKLPHYLRCNFFNGLHGRALPIAVAINVGEPGIDNHRGDRGWRLLRGRWQPFPAHDSQEP